MLAAILDLAAILNVLYERSNAVYCLVTTRLFPCSAPDGVGQRTSLCYYQPRDYMLHLSFPISMFSKEKKITQSK